jgi:hypothetical protein
MTEKSSLMVGVKLHEVATKEMVYQNCTVLHADSIGLAFEVERTVSEEGNVETVVSQILVPWANVNHVIVMEQRL